MTKRNSGFTLAEVLITLAIIGVVAALTIPTLINNYQKKALETSFVKSYSTVQNGFKNYMARQGCTDLKCAGLDVIFYSHKKSEWIGAFNEIFKIVNSCTGDVSCWVDQCQYLSITGEKSCGGYSGMTFWFDTVDGMRVYWGGENSIPPLYIDTNGYSKGPNRIGYDFFAFYIDKNSNLQPMGKANKPYIDNSGMYEFNWDDTEGMSLCGRRGEILNDEDLSTMVFDAYYCGARIMDEGFKITYF